MLAAGEKRLLQNFRIASSEVHSAKTALNKLN